MLVRTVQHLHVRHFTKDAGFFLPTTTNQLEWKHQNLFCIKEKHSQLHHNPFGFPEALKSYVHPASHHLMPGGGRSHKHQRFMAALPGCSPDRGSFHSLGNGVSTFSWLAPSAPQVWGGPTPPSQHRTQGVTSHTEFFHPLFSGKALLKQHFRDISVFPQTQTERKNPKPLKHLSNTTCTCICMESSSEALFCSASNNCSILCSSCCFDTIVSVSLLCKLWISLSLATSLFCTSVAETSGFEFRSQYLTLGEIIFTVNREAD